MEEIKDAVLREFQAQYEAAGEHGNPGMTVAQVIELSSVRGAIADTYEDSAERKGKLMIKNFLANPDDTRIVSTHGGGSESTFRDEIFVFDPKGTDGRVKINNFTSIRITHPGSGSNHVVVGSAAAYNFAFAWVRRSHLCVSSTKDQKDGSIRSAVHAALRRNCGGKKTQFHLEWDPVADGTVGNSSLGALASTEQVLAFFLESTASAGRQSAAEVAASTIEQYRYQHQHERPYGTTAAALPLPPPPLILLPVES